MDATKGNGLTAGNSQPAIEHTTHTPNSTATAESIGAFPSRHNTVTAEVLCRLISGENLTGMDAVFGCSTTRLSAVIFYLSEEYGWTIDHVDIDVGTNDGRVVPIRAYFLTRGDHSTRFRCRCIGVLPQRARCKGETTQACT